MGLIKSLKKMTSTIKNIFVCKVDETTDNIEKKNIVSLANKDVKNVKEKVQEGINKAADLKISINKLEQEKENAVKKLEKVDKDYSLQINEIKELKKLNASEEVINQRKFEASALLKIKKSIISANETLDKTIDNLKKSYSQLIVSLKVMQTNISVMECELTKQTAKKNYIDLHNSLVSNINGYIEDSATPYLAKLSEINTKDEAIIELKGEVFGESTISNVNYDVDEELERDINS